MSSLRFQLIGKYWELCFGPAYVDFARNSSHAGTGFTNGKAGSRSAGAIMLACGERLFSPVFALGCS